MLLLQYTTGRVKLEKDLQKKCIAFAKRYGFLARKIHAEGVVGWPDLLLINRQGSVLFVELKHPDRTGRVSTAQQRERRNIEEHGGRVLVIDNFNEFKQLILELACVPRP